ncbi:threonine--tRNA ligase [archaeon]|jgi:threonyl-tRNA synthetase|nr:threonine--tRNA ligase [archaeon]
MKTLNLHVDYIEWQALKKALKSIPDLTEKEKHRTEEALVVLTAVEKNDSLEILPQYIQNIKDITEQIKTKTIVLYPYAHLSKNLGSPNTAIKILEEAEKELKKDGYKVERAPFGYYKSFELKVKGHPLSELSREIISGNETIEAELTEDERKRLLKEISKSKLDTSKLKENDHRIIGRKMDLWSFNEVAPGMVFWHDKGLHLKDKLTEYWKEVHRKANYQEISTPIVMDKKLWEISGHWRLYKENMFTTKYEKRNFAIKPMNCPGGMLVYKNSPKSYKDLPLRVGELGIVHRQELSGTLAGLFRVIQFTQDDAHIFCTKKQLHDEIIGVVELFRNVISTFGFKDFRYTLSVRSDEKKDKYLGDDKIWASSEKALSEGLKSLKIKFERMKGEAKFYGPSLDLLIKDSLGREWQCATLQLDFALPQRFGVTYTNEKGKDQTPLMLHRVIFGSLERFLGVLTEHLNGKFPLWMSPNQVKVLTMSEKSDKYAEEIYNKLKEQGLRVELDTRDESIGKKVREASIQRFNYLITIGENEQKEKTIAVKVPDKKEIETMKLDDFIEKVKGEVEERK